MGCKLVGIIPPLSAPKIEVSLFTKEKANSFSKTLQIGSEVFHKLKEILKENNLNTAVGDEGGFAPDLKSNEEALDYIVNAIKKAEGNFLGFLFVRYSIDLFCPRMVTW